MRIRLCTLTCLAVAAALLLGACGSGQLIASVSIAPETISPNGDRVDDTTVIAYALGRDAVVSVYVLDDAGNRYPLREDEPRPAGHYEMVFDGAVPAGEEGVSRQVLPAGTYRCLIEAVDAEGRREQRQGDLKVEHPDLVLPAIENVVAVPTEISPYDPNLSSQARVSYRLTKEASITPYVIEQDGRRTRLADTVVMPPGEYATIWDGLIRNRVPPAGTYAYVLQARDAAGNTVERQVPITVSGTEEPDAHIVRVTFTPQQIVVGDTVEIAVTVRNTGNVPLRTHGPNPGYVYSTRDTFASIEGGRHADQSRLWRVGVDWAGGLGAEGARYPYRWGFGRDLAPGEEVTVIGYLRILEDYPQIRVYAGLINERVKYHVDKVGMQMIEISR